MADSKLAYGADTAIVVATIGSLANDGSATSDEVVNTANLFRTALLRLAIASASSGVLSTGYVEIWLKPALLTTEQSDNTNDIRLDTMVINANSTTFKMTIDIASRMGGILPPFWKVRLVNKSGAALSASGHTISYRGVYATVS